MYPTCCFAHAFKAHLHDGTSQTEGMTLAEIRLPSMCDQYFAELRARDSE